MTELVLTMHTLPPTLNDIIAQARANKFASASTKKQWTDAIAIACHKAKVKPISGTVYLEYVWRVKNFQRDQDNVTSAQKYILDGLVAANVIEQDNLSVIKSPVIHHFDKSDHDGFSIFIRDRESWEKRRWNALLLDELPVATVGEIILQVPLSTGNATRTRKLPARARARKTTTSSHRNPVR